MGRGSDRPLFRDGHPVGLIDHLFEAPEPLVHGLPRTPEQYAARNQQTAENFVSRATERALAPSRQPPVEEDLLARRDRLMGDRSEVRAQAYEKRDALMAKSRKAELQRQIAALQAQLASMGDE